MAILIDGYDDIEEVARGGFGVVYKARHVNFDRIVALKVLSQLEANDDRARRWERECRAMGALSWHPNIVVVYDLGVTADNHPFLSMELLDRGSLADRIMTEGRLPWADAVSMIIQVSGALQAAHDAGVLHRDIKPENVLVGLYGEAKLTDFGLATGDNAVQTAAGMASFTLAHASPEALAGERVTTSGDVYSLGSTLYHLLAGRAPFVRSSDENLLAAVQRVINDPVPDLRPLGVPDPVALVVEAAMAKDPAARPQAPAEVGRALQQAQQTLGLAVTELRLDPRGGDGAPSVPPPLGSADHSGATLTGAGTPPPDPGPLPSDVDDAGATVTVATSDLVVGDAAPVDVGLGGVDESGATVTVATAASPGRAVDVPPVPPSEPVAPPPPTAPASVPPPSPAAPPASVPGGAPAAGPPAGAPPSPAEAKKGSKAPLLLGVAAVLVLVVVAAAVLLSGGGGDDGDDDAGGGGGGGGDVVGDEVGAVVASIPVGATPRGVAADDGAAWVANRDDGTVSRVDTAADEVTATVEVGEGPRDVAVGLGSVWVTSLEAAEVARLDPADGTVLDTIAFDGGPQSVTTAAGLVWVTDRADSTVVAIDPDTLEQVDEIEVGADPSAVVADGDEFLWVTNREDGTLSKVDLGAGSVADTIDVGEAPAEAAVDGDSVWLASEGTSSVLRIDKQSGELLATIDLGVRVGGVAVDDDGNPWVDGLSALIRLDPDTNEVVGQVDIGGELREVAAGEGSLWTVPHDGVILTRVDPN